MGFPTFFHPWTPHPGRRGDRGEAAAHGAADRATAPGQFRGSGSLWVKNQKKGMDL